MGSADQIIRKSFQMNRAFIILLIFLLSRTGSGQITIDNTDMPQPGDVIRASITTNLTGIDFSLTGQDYVWDFTDLVPLTQDIDTFVSIEQTPLLYRIVFQFQTNANLAQSLSEIIAIPNMEITEPYLYYANMDEYYANEGFAFTLSSVPFPVNFSSPDVLYEFPLTDGREYNSTATFNLQIPGLAYLSVDRQRTSIVDGWGTVITPFGSFEALRVYSVIWLADEMGLPVIAVTREGLTGTISYIDSLRLPGQVHERNLIGTSHKEKLPLAFDLNDRGLQPGVYIIQISTEGYFLTRKAVLQR